MEVAMRRVCALGGTEAVDIMALNLHRLQINHESSSHTTHTGARGGHREHPGAPWGPAPGRHGVGEVRGG